MKSTELKTVSLSRITCENLVTLIVMQPSTTMIKILIFRNYAAFDEPQFVKKPNKPSSFPFNQRSVS